MASPFARDLPRREHRKPGWDPVIEFDGRYGRFEMAFPRRHDALYRVRSRMIPAALRGDFAAPARGLPLSRSLVGQVSAGERIADLARPFDVLWVGDKPALPLYRSRGWRYGATLAPNLPPFSGQQPLPTSVVVNDETWRLGPL